MYQSFYAYNITRPYPYKWFTPVLIIGGIIAAGLFSLLNVATNGYELIAKSSTNPNETLAQKDWLSSVPSFLIGVRQTCDSTIIPLQSRMNTNNSALPYTVDRVWRTKEGGGRENLGSLVYFNQPLQQCRIIFVDTNIETQVRSAAQLARIPVGGTVEARAECFFDSQDGRTFIQLTSTYDPIPTSNQSIQYFLYTSQNRQANLYWGSSLMRIYWANLMRTFADANNDEKHRWVSANLQVKYDSQKPEITDDDMRNTDFFSITCFFNRQGQPTGKGNLDSCDGRNNITSLSDDGAGVLHQPNFWASYNVLSKAMYYTALADLGRDDKTIPNLLSRASLVEDLSRNLTQTRKDLGAAFEWGIGSDISSQSFVASDFPDLDLHVTPSVLASTYLCKVRKLKNPASLVMAVIVSNLVFLSALWTAYVWCVDVFLVGKGTVLEPCQCYANNHGHRSTSLEGEMTPLKPSGKSEMSDGDSVDRW